LEVALEVSLPSMYLGLSLIHHDTHDCRLSDIVCVLQSKALNRLGTLRLIAGLHDACIQRHLERKSAHDSTLILSLASELEMAPGITDDNV
jgi:hypothetical protein